jgi:hypothetical protein
LTEPEPFAFRAKTPAQYGSRKAKNENDQAKFDPDVYPVCLFVEGLGGRMTKFELRLIAATVAFIPLSILFVYAYEAYRREHPEPLLDAARRGEFLALTLDAATCEGSDIGELVCGKRYIARYLPESNKWLVHGPTKLNPNTIAAFAAPPGSRGTISVIGIPGIFDNAGKLTLKGKEAGTVAFANR